MYQLKYEKPIFMAAFGDGDLKLQRIASYEFMG
jgi:hypothetical protein